MRNFLAMVALLLSTLQFVNASPVFNEFSTEILETHGNTATIKNSDNIVVGSSGIVIHTFKSGVSTIVARVDVVSKDADKASVEFDIFKLSTQEAFPKTGITPAIGDRVQLNYLYDRALIVAPNYDVYKEITNKFPDMEWIHPDIVATYLAAEFRPNPDKEVFQQICTLNSASLIFFALNNDGYFVDCNTFKILKTVKTAAVKQAQVPFYTRISDIDTSWIKWSGEKITDYDAHYRSILGQ